jgi:hypothetical protein
MVSSCIDYRLQYAPKHSPKVELRNQRGVCEIELQSPSNRYRSDSHDRIRVNRDWTGRLFDGILENGRVQRREIAGLVLIRAC